MLNKKNIISAIILISSIVISCLFTFSIKGNADEETLQQVKAELQEQINNKSTELEEKDKKIDELNKKLNAQEETINTLNNTVNSLSNTVENTKDDLNETKQIQKSDKKEVVNHADKGDEKLQKQVDEVKQNQPKQLTEEERNKLLENRIEEKVQK